VEVLGAQGHGDLEEWKDVEKTGVFIPLGAPGGVPASPPLPGALGLGLWRPVR